MSGDQVDVQGRGLRVRRITRGRLRMLEFMIENGRIAAIEQNADKPSNGARLGGRSPGYSAQRLCGKQIRRGLTPESHLRDSPGS